MRLLGTLPVLCAVAFAQPVITRGPIVHYKSDNNATVYWETNVSSSHITEWGTSSGNYTHDGASTRIIRSNANNTYHGWYLTGLPANTTIYYRVGSGTNGSNCNEGTDCTFSTEQTFTTDAAIYPVEPTAPDESWSTNIHTAPVAPNTDEWNLSTGSGRIVTMNSSCKRNSDGTTTLQGVLTAAESLNTSENLEIRIPAGAVCAGRYVFNPRASHTGWLIVRTANAYSTIPPEGVKTSDNWAHTQPILRANTHWATASGLTFLANTCKVGHGFFYTGQTSGFPLYLCGSDGGAQPPTKTITAYNPTGQVFTVVGHGYADENLVIINNTGLSIDSTSTARRISRIDADTFTLAGVTITGTFDGSGNVTEEGDYQTVGELGLLSTGSGAPVGSCTDGNYYQDTTISPNTQSGYLCSGTTWYPIQFRSLTSGPEQDAIQIASGTKKVRFVGLKITKTPGLTTNLSTYGASEFVNTQRLLVHVDFNAEDIVIDRCDIDGLGYPDRTQVGVNLHGKRSALINSRVRRIDHWLNGLVSGNWEAYAINIIGPGPGRIENNDISSTGIDMFWPDTSDATVGTPRDYVIRRNKIIGDLSTLKGHPSNTLGLYYYNRHAIECKKCDRMLWIGNEVKYNWSATNQGAIIGMTPQVSSTPPANLTITSATNGVLTMAATLTPQFLISYPDMTVRITGTSSAHDGLWKIASASGSTIMLANPPTASSSGGTLSTVGIPSFIGNLRFAYNTFAHFPALLLVTGFPASGTNNYPSWALNKLKFDNNLVYDINSSSAAGGGWKSEAPGWEPQGAPNYLYSSARGPGNIQIVNNTFQGQATSVGFSNNLLYTDATVDDLGKRNRLDFKNNLISAPADTSTSRDGGLIGTVGLDSQWVDYFVDGNVITTANTTTNKPVGSPANIYAESDANIGWQKASARNYQVRYDSAYFQAGKGADIAALEAEQGKVSNPRVMRIAATTAEIGYYAPDSAACTVEYSTSTTWGTGGRASDSGGARVRNVSISGLTPDTPHYIRVLCAVEQPSLELRTTP